MDYMVAAVIVGLIVVAVFTNRRLPGSEVREILTRTSAHLGLGPLLLIVALLNMQLWGMSRWTMSLMLLAVAALYARELLADQAGGVGYLLKDRVFSDDQFVDAPWPAAARRWILRSSPSCWPAGPGRRRWPG